MLDVTIAGLPGLAAATDVALLLTPASINARVAAAGLPARGFVCGCGCVGVWVCGCGCGCVGVWVYECFVCVCVCVCVCV